MINRISLLKGCFWLGAIIDGFVALQMLFPMVLGFNFIPGSSISRDMEIGLSSAAPLMLGWTVLLIWASSRPVERRAVLLLTVFPLIISWMTIEIVSAGRMITTWDDTIPTLAVQSVLITVFLIGYRSAGQQTNENQYLEEIDGA
jgi:hypothetical protein